jgi:hypothetical protein
METWYHSSYDTIAISMKSDPVHIAPVALFVYKRPDHLRKTLDALLNNKLAAVTPLYVFADAAKKPEHQAGVDEVRDIIKHIRGFKSVEVILREKNLGIAGSIISGVNHVMSRHGSCIIVEDDIIVSPAFLDFMNGALRYYKDDSRIATISGYTYPHTLFKIPKHYRELVFFTQRIFPWGWATWADRWNQIIWDNSYYEIIRTDPQVRNTFNMIHPDISDWLTNKLNNRADTWSIQMTFFFMQQNKYTVYPIHSYTNNIGNDTSGATKQIKPQFINNTLNASKDIVFSPLKTDRRIILSFRKAGILKKYVRKDIYYYYQKLCDAYDRQKEKKGLVFTLAHYGKRLDRKGILFTILRKTIHSIVNILSKILDFRHPPRPYMTEHEIAFLEKYLSKNSSVLEWGSGNSTLYYSQFVREYTAIEHNEQWFKTISKRIRKNTKLILIPPNGPYDPKIGNGWNQEFEGSYEQFRQYVDVVDTINFNFDIVLIDGRARIACAKKILPLITQQTKVFIHDFERYQLPLDQYYTIENQIGSLALLRKKLS